MKTLLAKEARALVVPTVAAMFVYVALAVVITLYSGKGSYAPTLIVGRLLMPLIALLLGSWAFSSGGSSAVAEWESAWPMSRLRPWLAKVLTYTVALALIQIVCSVVPVMVMYGHQYAMPLRMLWRVLSAPWKTIGSPQFCFVFMVLAAALMFAGAMRKSAAALGLSTLVVGMLSFLYLLTVGDWIPSVFGPKLGIAQGYMTPPALIGCSLLMTAILLWSSWRGLVTTLPLAYARRLAITVRWAGLLTLAALPLFAGILVWSAAPHQADLKAVAAPTVSPDGRRVAFLGGRYAATAAPGAGVWIMSADGAGLRCVGRGPVQSVRWLPDNRRLLVTWHGAPLLPMMRRQPTPNAKPPRTSTWLVDGNTGRIDRLPPTPLAADMMPSPTGQWLYTDGKALSLTPPYASHDLGLAKDTPVLGWLPDGVTLLLGDPAFGPNDTITGLNVQTGQKATLARAPAGPEPAPAPGVLALLRRRMGRQPAAVHPLPAPEQSTWWVWTNRIVQRSSSGGYVSVMGRPFVWAIHRSTGQRVSLPGNPLVNGFSPDGRYCWTDQLDPRGAASSSEPGPVVVTDLTTGRPTATMPGEQVGEFFSEITRPGNLQWSPDGSRVAREQDTFSIGASAYDSGEKYRVWTAHADGTDPRTPFAVGENRHAGTIAANVTNCVLAGWTADNKLIVDDDGLALVSIDPETGQKSDLLRLKAPPRPATLRGMLGGVPAR